jgi:GDPmannose 4,6-dehydratase
MVLFNSKLNHGYLMKKALITGITGQDGSYLAEFLLSKGYEVHGLIRRASTFNTGRINHIYVDPHEKGVKLFLHYGDLSDAGQLTDIIYNIRPDEIYHVGAQSHVMVSFQIPEYTGDITALGTIRLLEAIKRSGTKVKFYQASSSEMFGASPPPQNEKTPFYPRSPYAVAKVYAYWITVNYRESYRLFACNGILFNHESPRRGETFVTRKISQAIANILAGKQRKLYLGNLDARRDWGCALEYIESIWMMLQQDTPDDYVVGTGESHSVRELLEKAFYYAGVEIEWKGKGTKQKGIIKSVATPTQSLSPITVGDVVVEIDPKYIRPTEVNTLVADISKIKGKLGWEPRIKFEDLVKIMVDYDLERIGLPCKGEGKKVLDEMKFTWTRNNQSTA